MMKASSPSGRRGGNQKVRVSFGLYANDNYISTATRALESTLSLGQSIVLKMDNGFVANDSAVGFTSAGLQVAFTLTGAQSYSVSITPNGGSTTTLNGTFLIPANIEYIQLYNRNAGSGASSDAFFNDLQVVPEPATAGLMLLGVAGLLLRKRRG